MVLSWFLYENVFYFSKKVLDIGIWNVQKSTIYVFVFIRENTQTKEKFLETLLIMEWKTSDPKNQTPKHVIFSCI